MSKLLATLLALSAVATLAIGGYALAAEGAPAPRTEALVQVPESSHADVRETPDDVTARSELAEGYEGPGTVDEAVHACLELDGRTVCDTFGEVDEGPGTR